MLLVGNPEINIIGAPIGTICCYAVMCLLNYIFLCRCMEVRPRLRQMLLRPVVSCAIMGAAAWGVNGLAYRALGSALDASWLHTALAMGLAVAVAVVIYLVMIIFTRAVTMEDMKLIPKGEKLAKLLHIR